MNFINSILNTFVGNKSQKDVKALQATVAKVRSYEAGLMALSNDELREKTVYFKDRIKQARLDKDQKIASLKTDVEKIEDIDKREELYESIDALEKEAYEISEKTLGELLPEAFAVVQETARRFKENTEIRVTSTAKNHELAADKNYITLEGDETI